MTNEQLRAMARRVLELVVRKSEITKWAYLPTYYGYDIEQTEAAAVAILREELGKWPECPKCKKDVPVWTTSKGECDCGMRYENGRFSDDHITHAAVTCCCAIADDPTQTIVIDT